MCDVEAAVLARAAELLGPRGDFAPLVASPLLIRRVRSSGGAGGRRISAGLTADGDEAVFAVLAEDHLTGRSLSACVSATASAHAFNEALRRAGRDGLSARPEAQPTSAGALLDAALALLG